MSKRKKPDKNQLPDSRKAFIKQSFDTIDHDSLNAQERNYYNKVKGGKARANSGVRFKGKYATRELTELITGVAKNKGQTVKEFLSDEKNEKAIKRYIEKGETTIQRSMDKIFDDLADMDSRRSVFVNDGNGIIKVPSGEILEKLLEFNQIAKSYLSVVDIRFTVNTYPDGKIVYEIHDFDTFNEIVEEGDPDKLLDYMDENEIFYIISDKEAGKK